MVQWHLMKQLGFVPGSAKGVVHEAQNGIQLCAVHHGQFDAYRYYIHWVPEVFF